LWIGNLDAPPDPIQNRNAARVLGMLSLGMKKQRGKVFLILRKYACNQKQMDHFKVRI
jgi:hypothetical protein